MLAAVRIERCVRTLSPSSGRRMPVCDGQTRSGAGSAPEDGEEAEKGALESEGVPPARASPHGHLHPRNRPPAASADLLREVALDTDLLDGFELAFEPVYVPFLVA